MNILIIFTSISVLTSGEVNRFDDSVENNKIENKNFLEKAVMKKKEYAENNFNTDKMNQVKENKLNKTFFETIDNSSINTENIKILLVKNGGVIDDISRALKIPVLYLNFTAFKKNFYIKLVDNEFGIDIPLKYNRCEYICYINGNKKPSGIINLCNETINGRFVFDCVGYKIVENKNDKGNIKIIKIKEIDGCKSDLESANEFEKSKISNSQNEENQYEKTNKLINQRKGDSSEFDVWNSNDNNNTVSYNKKSNNDETRKKIKDVKNILGTKEEYSQRISSLKSNEEVVDESNNDLNRQIGKTNNKDSKISIFDKRNNEISFEKDDTNKKTINEKKILEKIDLPFSDKGLISEELTNESINVSDPIKLYYPDIDNGKNKKNIHEKQSNLNKRESNIVSDELPIIEKLIGSNKKDRNIDFHDFNNMKDNDSSTEINYKSKNKKIKKYMKIFIINSFERSEYYGDSINDVTRKIFNRSKEFIENEEWGKFDLKLVLNGILNVVDPELIFGDSKSIYNDDFEKLKNCEIENNQEIKENLVDSNYFRTSKLNRIDKEEKESNLYQKNKENTLENKPISDSNDKNIRNKNIEGDNKYTNKELKTTGLEYNKDLGDLIKNALDIDTNKIDEKNNSLDLKEEFSMPNFKKNVFISTNLQTELENKLEFGEEEKESVNVKQKFNDKNENLQLDKINKKNKVLKSDKELTNFKATDDDINSAIEIIDKAIKEKANHSENFFNGGFKSKQKTENNNDIIPYSARTTIINKIKESFDDQSAPCDNSEINKEDILERDVTNKIVDSIQENNKPTYIENAKTEPIENTVLENNIADELKNLQKKEIAFVKAHKVKNIKNENKTGSDSLLNKHNNKETTIKENIQIEKQNDLNAIQMSRKRQKKRKSKNKKRSKKRKTNFYEQRNISTCYNNIEKNEILKRKQEKRRSVDLSEFSEKLDNLKINILKSQKIDTKNMPDIFIGMLKEIKNRKLQAESKFLTSNLIIYLSSKNNTDEEDGGIEGYTYIEGACSFSDTYSIIKLRYNDSLFYHSKVMAHEILHSLGAHHDSDLGCDNDFLMESENCITCRESDVSISDCTKREVIQFLKSSDSFCFDSYDANNNLVKNQSKNTEKEGTKDLKIKVNTNTNKRSESTKPSESFLDTHIKNYLSENSKKSLKDLNVNIDNLLDFENKSEVERYYDIIDVLNSKKYQQNLFLNEYTNGCEEDNNEENNNFFSWKFLFSKIYPFSNIKKRNVPCDGGICKNGVCQSRNLFCERAGHKYSSTCPQANTCNLVCIKKDNTCSLMGSMGSGRDDFFVKPIILPDFLPCTIDGNVGSCLNGECVLDRKFKYLYPLAFLLIVLLLVIFIILFLYP